MPLTRTQRVHLHFLLVTTRSRIFIRIQFAASRGVAMISLQKTFMAIEENKGKMGRKWKEGGDSTVPMDCSGFVTASHSSCGVQLET